MVGIQGINGIPEPKPERPAKLRPANEKESVQGSQGKDDLLISSEAQAAAAVARAIRVSQGQSGIRAERVASAKESIERGDYKKPEVVAKVAERISKYLP